MKRQHTTCPAGGAYLPPNRWRANSAPVRAGSGSWQVESWLPANGCGLVEQARSVSCAVAADSGTHTRSVVCLDPSGVEVDDSPSPRTRRVTIEDDDREWKPQWLVSSAK